MTQGGGRKGISEVWGWVGGSGSYSGEKGEEGWLTKREGWEGEGSRKIGEGRGREKAGGGG